MGFTRFYSRHKPHIRYGLLLTGLCFLGYLAYQNRESLISLIQQANRLLLISSIAIGILGNLVQAFYLNELFRKNGIRIEPSVAIKMFMAGQIGKYVPGKIWSVVFQDAYLNRKGSASAVLKANLEHTLGMLFLVTVTAAAIAFYFYSGMLLAVFLLLALAAFCYFNSLTILQKLGEILSSTLIKDSGNGPETDSIPATSTFRLVVIFFSFIGTLVLSNLFVLEALFDFPTEQTLAYIALLCSAWIAGVLALIFPAGMGVREVVFISIASLTLQDYSLETLTAIALSLRAWQILQEFLGFLLSTLIPIPHNDTRS